MQRVPANSLAFLTERLCGTYPRGLVWSLGRAELHATGLLLCNTLAHIIKSTHHCKTVETSTGVSGVATWSVCFRWRSMKTFDLWRKTTSRRVKTNCQVQKQHDRLRECRRVWNAPAHVTHRSSRFTVVCTQEEVTKQARVICGSVMTENCTLCSNNLW